MKRLLLVAVGPLPGAGLPAARTLAPDTAKTKGPVSPFVYGAWYRLDLR